MTVTDNIPADALTIWYESGRRGGEYSIWKRYAKHGGDELWYWSALGNGGVEDTAEEASSRAQRWIRDRQ